MRGLVLDGPRRIVVRDDLPDPRVEHPTDALVRVRAAGLCGSDLHPYRGHEAARAGVVPGHEVVGEVVAVGPAVRAVTEGTRVVVPFTTSCGACGPCGRGLTARCELGELFGYGDPDPAGRVLHGGQAELVRVPLADGTLVALPETIDDVTGLLLCDNLPTAATALVRAERPDGAPLVVLGLGAVGLCAVALAVGSGPVVAVDPVADRQAAAASLGAIAVRPDEASAAVRELAAEGVPSVVEAAGSRAAQRAALGLLRPGGTLSTIAVPTEATFGFTPVDAYDANLTVRAGRASVRARLDALVPRVAAGELPVPTDLVVTHRGVPLADGPATYAAFDAQADGLVKAAFDPAVGG
ncbi:alcohol dehydrogenase catalytic domain-containing protein [Nitriliruptoraceae bacterium ZYF776]|nr:alcohol dehydrogenase catalytic domain-containing protein [Profundirhabdus halotolerans]